MGNNLVDALILQSL